MKIKKVFHLSLSELCKKHLPRVTDIFLLKRFFENAYLVYIITTFLIHEVNGWIMIASI